MPIIYEDAEAGVVIHHADIFSVLPTLDANSIDACVTDPPYGIAFMGKDWDDFSAAGEVGAACDAVAFQRWCERWARELYRVLRPGGYVLAFGGTRMFHRLAVGLEDAGFEIRDTLSWLYGSGFPKSLDISKAVDRGYRRDESNQEYIWRPASGAAADVYAVTAFVRAARDAAGIRNREIDSLFGFNGMAGHWSSSTSQPSVPTWPQWEKLKELLRCTDEMDQLVVQINGGKGDRSIEGTALGDRDVVGTARGKDYVAGDMYAPGVGEYIGKDYDLTTPRTAAAESFAGWGTALKPGWEPVVMARKPFPGTLSQNALLHRTGGLNIDGCRIDYVDDDDKAAAAAAAAQRINCVPGVHGRHFTRTGDIQKALDGYLERQDGGRWPANVLLDEEAAALLDEQSGELTSGANPERRGSDKFRGIYSDFKGQEACEPARGVDVGGASRFFYVAKPSREERDLGCDSLPVRSGGELTERKDGSAGAENHRAGAGHGGGRNIHPTVKPVALMRWLIRLVTPPDGTVIDPFAGSGTTGMAAMYEQRRFVGIEREQEYADIAARRITAAAPLFCRPYIGSAVSDVRKEGDEACGPAVIADPVLIDGIGVPASVVVVERGATGGVQGLLFGDGAVE